MQEKTKNNYVHVMKYMGSKRELLDRIAIIVEKNLKPGKKFLDLFSGTCGVGLQLRDKHAILSNDIQIYSKIISEGIIEVPPTNISKKEIWDLLRDDYEKNYSAVSRKIGGYIEESRKFKQVDCWDQKVLKKYLAFSQSLPSPINTRSETTEGQWLASEYFERQKNKIGFPYLQTMFLFSENYFSTEQALEIDSLRYAIDCLSKKNHKLARLLQVALIHAHSYVSAGTGHFAQFRDLSTPSSVKDVFIYRSKSAVDYLLRKAEEIAEATKINLHHEKSASFCGDYRNLLDNKRLIQEVGLVYADPPYSFVHYSRFYHATETLCRYDYPTVEHKGRYRLDRHQSPFCIKTKAPKAFQEMLTKIRPYKIPVLISYSNTGMISLEEVQSIARGVGYKTNLAEIAHKHSTMGRLGDKNRDVTEALLLCY